VAPITVTELVEVTGETVSSTGSATAAVPVAETYPFTFLNSFHNSGSHHGHWACRSDRRDGVFDRLSHRL